MALAFTTVSFAAASLRPPESSSSYRYPVSNFIPRKRSVSISPATASAGSPESSSVVSEVPEIEIEFLGPKPDGDGKYPVNRAKAVSGERLLRTIMLDNSIELYATYGKVMNCGGGGSCGTCIVEILDGWELLNERTNTELRYLKKGASLYRSLNLGGFLVKLLLEIKKTLARLWFRGFPSGRNDDNGSIDMLMK